MGKGPSFRLKLALLMGVVTALLVLVPVSLLWSLTEKSRLSRLDRELFDLSKPNLQRLHGRNHYRRFENSLAMTGNGESYSFWAVNQSGVTLHRMSTWPEELTADRMPEPGPMLKRTPKLEKGPRDNPEALRVSEAGFLNTKAAGRSWRLAASTNEVETLYVAYDLSAFDSELAEERRQMFLIVPIALVVSGLVSWWMAGRAMRPVRRLSERLEGIGAKDLGKRLDDAVEDREFRQLVEVFNGMMERLEQSFQQATRFSADASHELRTPLTLMQGELEQGLNQAREGSEEQIRYARLLADVAELRDITEKLLLLAGSDAGTLPVGRDRVDFSALVAEMAEDLRLLEEDRRLRVEIEPELEVAGDVVLLRRVLQNLSSNALRHGDPDGEVAIELEGFEGELHLRVSNDGPEIPDEERARIFDRFVRLDTARGRTTGGSGLGLALAREIARAHGGELELLPGGRVCFRVKLPRWTCSSVLEG